MPNIIIPTDSPQTQAIDKMATRVARLVGAQDDVAGRDMAMEYLDAAADQLNLQGIFLFRRQTYTEDDLTSGQSSITPPPDFAWPIHPIRCLDSDGTIQRDAEWVSWEKYKLSIGDPTSTGIPLFFAIDNELEDDSIVFYPTVDTSQVSSIEFHYMARIERPSEVADLNITPEAREVLIAGAQFLLMQERYADKPQIWSPWRTNFTRLTRQLKATARRGAGQIRRQASVDERGGPLDALFDGYRWRYYFPIP